MRKNTKVIDQNGNIFPSISSALRAYGFAVCGPNAMRIYTETGFVSGKTVLKVYDEEESAPSPDLTTVAMPQSNPIWDKLALRYSQKELEQIANGEGIDKRRIDFPEIHLTGRHHRIAVISDTHIGSVYSPEDWHKTVSEYVNTHDIECVLHCGDLVDGLKIGRAGTQVYELKDVGFDAQKESSIELMSLYNVPIYIISGNHDAYFQEFHGANLVKAVSDAVPNMTYIGHNSADIDIDGAIIRLFHGTDGSSYALSYRLQKIVEGINGGHKPNILLAGHVHKFCYVFCRNIHAIDVPCMQKQTKFMEGKKLEAHTGFLVLDFDVIDRGVCNLSVQFFPFYA